VEGEGVPAAVVETHGMDPLQVLRMVRSLGGTLPALRVVGCEPAGLGTEDDPARGLSDAVQAAVDEAVSLVERLIRETPGRPRAGANESPFQAVEGLGQGG
jgi:hydrogenase maturation protease